MKKIICGLFCASTFLMVSNAFAVPHSSGDGRFAVGFDGGDCPSHGAKRCVLGRLPKNSQWQLLGAKSSTACHVHAVRSFESEWDSGSFPLTFITLKTCPSFTFKLAVKASKLIPYSILSPASLPAPTDVLRHKIDALIREQAPSIQSSSFQHQLVLSDLPPRIFRFPNMDRETYIVVYENAETLGDQVHFLYTHGTIRLIHSAASISSVFKLGQQYFIHYTFTCRIGCGWWGDLIFKFNKDSFDLELSDASTST